jgi:hypothetical protein
MSERPFPKRDIREAMAARLTQAAPELSAEKRAAAVRGFEEDLAAIVERWSQPYGTADRAADLLDPPG